MHLISKKIVKRYIASASRNVGTSHEMQKYVTVRAVLAWADCNFSSQGLSYNLYWKKMRTAPRFLFNVMLNQGVVEGDTTEEATV